MVSPPGHISRKSGLAAPMGSPRFVDVGGIRTRYFEGGRGRTIVLIHGGTYGTYYNAFHWSLNFEALSARTHVYAVDKIGMGYTDNPESDAGYTIARTADHLRDFLLTIGIRDAVLVGHSRGALPAARIAVTQPELVSGLVIVDSNTLGAEHPSTPRDFYARFNEDVDGEPDEEFVLREARANSYSADHIDPEFTHEILAVARLPKTNAARQAMREHDRQFRLDVHKVKYETLDAIRDRSLDIPVLVIWGLNDNSAPVALGYELFHHIAQAVPRTRLTVFNRAGHYVYREHPREVSRAILDVIDDIDGPSA